MPSEEKKYEQISPAIIAVSSIAEGSKREYKNNSDEFEDCNLTAEETSEVPRG
jgi:hypothetical protein